MHWLVPVCPDCQVSGGLLGEKLGWSWAWTEEKRSKAPVATAVIRLDAGMVDTDW